MDANGREFREIRQDSVKTSLLPPFPAIFRPLAEADRDLVGEAAEQAAFRGGHSFEAVGL